MTTTTTRGVDERSMMVRTTATRALILALTFLLVCSLGVSAAGFSTHPNALNPNVTDQELMNLWGILQDKIKALEAEFERWIAAGNPAANWETSPSGAELATLRKQLANVAEDAARRGFIRFPPEPGSAPPGSRWVRVLRRGMWAWTLARVITSSDPGKEALDVGIGMTCAYAGEVVGTLCFGPVGGVVGGIVGGALAPRVEEFAAGSGGREPEVKPAPPPPPPPVMAAAGPSSFLGGRALTLTVTGVVATATLPPESWSWIVMTAEQAPAATVRDGVA